MFYAVAQIDDCSIEHCNCTVLHSKYHNHHVLSTWPACRAVYSSTRLHLRSINLILNGIIDIYDTNAQCPLPTHNPKTIAHVCLSSSLMLMTITPLLAIIGQWLSIIMFMPNQFHAIHNQKCNIYIVSRSAVVVALQPSAKLQLFQMPGYYVLIMFFLRTLTRPRWFSMYDTTNMISLSRSL